MEVVDQMYRELDVPRTREWGKVIMEEKHLKYFSSFNSSALQGSDQQEHDGSEHYDPRPITNFRDWYIELSDALW